MISRILKVWLPLFFVATVLAGTILAVVQQQYRQSANDPQISIAEDVKVAFDSKKPTTILDTLPKNVDIFNSLSPFVILYNGKSGDEHALGGNVAFEARPNETEFDLPKGVFDWVRSHGEDRITWQPKSGVRIAAVILPLNNGDYVLAGRNMREIEKREQMLNLEVMMGWAVAVFGSLVVIGIVEFIFPPKKK